MARKRLPLPKRFNAALTEDAYARLRGLSERYGLSNNYPLSIILEQIDDIAGPKRLDAAFARFIAEYCPPSTEKPDF